MADLNFTGLAEILLARWEEFLTGWAPGGKLVGREFTAGNMRGGPGDSFKFNITTGRWADFATDERGGDMISLYAAIQGIKNGEAAKRLADLLNYNLSDSPYRAPDAKKTTTTDFHIARPPRGTEKPPMIHLKYGEPTDAWCYVDEDGEPIFWEARYDTPEGKEILPWSWAENIGKWVKSGFPAPRPVYGLDQLKRRPNAPVVIVEGPKCARAAQEVMGDVYVPVAWNGGANAANKTDWAALAGRKVLIWPDADKKLVRTQMESARLDTPVGGLIPYPDQPGIRVANEIAAILAPMCPEVKVLDVGFDDNRPDGWDVADALRDGWTWTQVKEWARPIAKAFTVTAVAHKNGAAPAVAVAQASVVVNTADEQPPDRSVLALLEEYGIAVNKNGTPNCNIDNSLRALENSKMVAGEVWFDTFHQKVYTTWNGPKREWADRDTLELTKRLQRELAFVRLSDTTMFQALTLYAEAHAKNEPHDWMETLVWDGKDRIADFFTDYLGAKASDYVRSASKNFWIGMVARIYKPGCKMDNMVVLEGPQGTLKSTALYRIGGAWFTETNESVSNKDFFLILQGRLLVEIAELHTFSKAEVTRIKQVITCRVDRYRAPYERLVSDHPRQSVFVGSTNEDTYLKDTTGNRRFWPIRCGRIYPDEITASREQLFAEAVAKFKSGASWWEMPKDETETEQEDRRQADAWEGMIAEWVDLTSRVDFAIADVMVECLKMEAARMDAPAQHRISRILKGMGFESRKEWKNGYQRRVWNKPGAELPLDHQVGGEPGRTPPPATERVPEYAESNDAERQDEGDENPLPQ